MAAGRRLPVPPIVLSLPGPELANGRVRERVRRGGHHVPNEVVRGTLPRRSPTLNVIAQAVAPLRMSGDLIAPLSHDFH
jgi:predicted ABC-type ATPase